MSVTKTVDVKVDVSDVECDDCGKAAERAFCARCFTDVEDQAGDSAIENYSPPEDETRASAAYEVRSWVERVRYTPAGLTAAEIALLERCADDLEVGHGR